MSRFTKDNTYLELLETFKKYEPLVKTKQRKEDDKYLLETFSRIFNLTNIDNLTKQDIVNFTSYKENRHWNGIHRQNHSILADFDKLKSSLRVLLDESIDINERIRRVRGKSSPEHVHGLGFTVITAILITAYKEKYPVFNNKVINAMKQCNVYPFKGSGKYAERYRYMIDLCTQIKKDTNLSFFEIDGIWHHILEDKPTIFKHSPGEQGYDFENQYNKSVMAIGWNKSGDLSQYEDDDDFELAAKTAIDNGNGKSLSYIMGQYNYLMNLNDHDCILYYKEGEIAGIAFISGDDYNFDINEDHGHQRKVNFLTNFKPHTIIDDELKAFFSKRTAINPLDKKLYNNLLIELSSSNPQINWEKILKLKLKKTSSNYKGITKDTLNRAEISSWSEFMNSMNWNDDFKEPINIKHCLGDFENQNSPKKNIIFFGPPGTGKSMCAKNLASLIASSPENIYKVQFHQSYSYENFIQGIRPDAKNGIVSYNYYEGPFVEFCNKAVNNPNQNYVFIIDEVNRGNLSRIFGELLYLLEYPEESLPLMYDQTKKLRIPKNAYIVGTMNSADRSIAMVDYALRRRFRFIEFTPNSKILREFYTAGDDELETAIKFFELLNQRINGIGKRLSIGHSYFIFENLKEKGISKSELRIIWETELSPLLEEYFANMPNKVADFTFENIWGLASQKVDTKGAA